MYVFINVGHLKNFKMGKMGGWSDMVKHRQRASKSKGKGDRKAAASQFYLGRIYSSGDVRVKQDDAEAARWFLLAAENGHAGSQFFMALRYSSGTGVPQDNDEAARCYRMAADQGLACAQFKVRSARATNGFVCTSHGTHGHPPHANPFFLPAGFTSRTHSTHHQPRRPQQRKQTPS